MEALNVTTCHIHSQPYMVKCPGLLCVLRFWPVRTFPWGKCEAMSSIHSDASLLKSLLFEHAYEDLKALTEARYYNYRDKAYATAAAARQTIPDVR